MHALGLILVATLVAGGSQQRSLEEEPIRVRLHPLDQGVEDHGPLATSLRRVDVSMAVPSGFREVYRVPGDDRVMRVDGALAAVFERSTYERTQRGLWADVPTSTIWVIEGAPLGAEPGHGMLLPVDPLSPAMVASSFQHPPPTAPSRGKGAAVGYGRMSELTWRAEAPVERRDLPNRFLTDRGYRRGLLSQLVRQIELTPVVDPQP